jgi:hypothetical protein
MADPTICFRDPSLCVEEFKNWLKTSEGHQPQKADEAQTPPPQQTQEQSTPEPQKKAHNQKAETQYEWFCL